MTKYFTKSSGYIEDDYYSPDLSNLPPIYVCEHQASYTGILDVNGEDIWRRPNPMGFGKDREW